MIPAVRSSQRLHTRHDIDGGELALSRANAQLALIIQTGAPEVSIRFQEKTMPVTRSDRLNPADYLHGLGLNIIDLPVAQLTLAVISGRPNRSIIL